MGNGHFKPSTDDYRMRLYDAEDLFRAMGGEDTTDTDEWCMIVEDFEALILANLPKSFETPRGRVDHQWDDTRLSHHNPYATNDGRVITYNGLVAVAVTWHDSYIYVHAFPRVTGGWSRYDDEPSNVAIHYLHNRLNLAKVWQALPVNGRVRTNAWCSDPCRNEYDESRGS